MSTELENLKSRRTKVIAEIAAIGSTSSSAASTDPVNAGGKPNKSGTVGVDHVGYKASLYAELHELNELIRVVSGGFTILTEADT